MPALINVFKDKVQGVRTGKDPRYSLRPFRFEIKPIFKEVSEERVLRVEGGEDRITFFDINDDDLRALQAACTQALGETE
jgi:hypothetical protein